MVCFKIILFSIFACSVSGKIPSYIRVCKRNDPDVEKCIKSSIEHLRPKLKNGIPELNVPALEPLRLDDFNLMSGPNSRSVNANISDLLVYGPSGFEIKDVKADLKRTRFIIQFVVPTLYFEGQYDMVLDFLFINFKGKGPITGNLTDYTFNCLMKADKIQHNNETFLKFRKFLLTMHQGTSQLELRNLFSANGDVLADAARNIVKENSDLLMDEIKPSLEQSLADKLTNIANRILIRFSYDALFPS